MERDRGQQNGSGMLVREQSQGDDPTPAISEQATVKVATANPTEVVSQTETVRLPPQAMTPTTKRRRDNKDLLTWVGIVVVTLVESGLLVMSLVPATKSAQLGWSATNGPFPTAAVPLVTAVFYLAPLITGFLARRWEVALVAATFPAWLGIGIYSVASSTQNGIFSLTAGAHPSYLVGTMELFAALGGFGWLTRRVIVNPAPHH